MPENLIAYEVSAFFEELLPYVESANKVADAQQRQFIKSLVYYRTAPVISDRERYYKGESDILAPILKFLYNIVDPGLGERFIQDHVEQRDAPQRIHASEYLEANGIINRIDFSDLLPFLHDVKAHGLLDANIKWSEIVLDMVHRYHKKVLITSTSEIYGKNANGPLKEEDDRILGSPLKSRWGYSAAKAASPTV